jgi:hypothetical protein
MAKKKFKANNFNQINEIKNSSILIEKETNFSLKKRKKINKYIFLFKSYSIFQLFKKNFLCFFIDQIYLKQLKIYKITNEKDELIEINNFT